MADPSVIVELELDPVGDPDTWTDISADVRDGSIMRGRSGELERFNAGTCYVTLNNADRAYDPQNADSTHYPNLKPMRRLRVSATYAAVNYPLFLGYVDSITQAYNGPNHATATIAATDAFKVLQATSLASSAYYQEVAADAPVAWWHLGEPVGSATLFDAVGAADLTVEAAPELGTESLVSREPDASVTFPADGTYLTGATGPVPITDAKPMSVECVFVAEPAHPSGGGTLFGQKNYSTGVGFTVIEVGGRIDISVLSGDGTLDNLRTVATSFNDGNVHHYVFTLDTDDEGHIYIDGVEVANEGAGPDDGTLSGNGDLSTSQYFFIGAGYGAGSAAPAMIGQLDEVAVYDYVLSPTRVAAHAEAVSTPWNGDTPEERAERILAIAGIDPALWDLDGGASVLQSATLGTSSLEHLQKVAESEFGLFFVMANGTVRLAARDALINQASQGDFSDAHGSDPGIRDIRPEYTDTLIRNDVTISRAEGVAQRVVDADSVAEFLTHSYALDGLYHNDDALSRYAAQFLVSEYAQPLQRISGLTVLPRTDPTDLFPQALARELGDLITVTHTPQGVGDPIEQASMIDGITHLFGPKRWDTVWTLTPAYAGCFLELNTGTCGLNEGRIYF